MFEFLSFWKTRRGYVKSGRLLADRILQHIGSERSDPIREMHFLLFFIFCVFKPEVGTWISDVSWRTTFCNILAASARILFVKCIFGRFSVFLRFQT